MKSILDIYHQLWSEKGERFMDEIFEKEVYKLSKPQLTIVDLGAYRGEFSFYCLPFAKKIYAVEPDPRPYKELTSLVDSFDASDVIKTFNFAIDTRDGEKSMDLSGYGGNRFVDGGTMVKTVSLPTFFKENNIEHVNILKVDIEGGEEAIFDSSEFGALVSQIDLIIGEHGGFKKLVNWGFKIQELPNMVLLATK